MALILKKFYRGYFWLFNDLADPRSVDHGLFLMASPVKPIILLGTYTYFICSLGPRLMKDRKPFEMKKILIGYNLMQIISNAYVTYQAFLIVLHKVAWDCAPIDYSDTPENIFILKVYHYFFLTKVMDLFDSLFFVLRKKHTHLSFLHIYHHIGMTIMCWAAVKFFGGGHGVWVGLINAFVHMLMYGYYALTVIDSKWKNNLPLKKLITQIQMVQFLTFIIIYGRLLFKPDCAYPKLCSYFFVPQNIFMLTMFADFYRKAYLKKSTTKNT